MLDTDIKIIGITKIKKMKKIISIIHIKLIGEYILKVKKIIMMEVTLKDIIEDIELVIDQMKKQMKTIIIIMVIPLIVDIEEKFKLYLLLNI